MPILTIRRGDALREIPFEGTPILSSLLNEVQHPCGGRGVCQKCAVEISGHISEPNGAEIKAGARLSCQVVLLGDAEVILPEESILRQIETSGGENLASTNPMPGRTGAAIDIGTTTLAMKRYDLATGAILGEAAMLNPQTAVAADVMGRIGAAMDGKLSLLQNQILSAIEAMLNKNTPDAMVITGNTTMLYLLAGRNPESLSHAPFLADCLFGKTEAILSVPSYLPPCMNAFVGADITCALLESGQCGRDETSLLCDVGTNGEIALWHDGRLFVTSTAAGPAFEGAGISCGCGSIAGAIDRVWIEDNQLRVHTIGEKTPVGLCGSGLIDAIACGLTLGLIDETGAMDDDEIILAPGVILLPKDVRAVQLAKAAIAAGIETLLETAKVDPEQIETLFIAGGFGNHLNVQSAARIGLIPEILAPKVRAIGNASLSGAGRILLNQDEMKRAQAIAESARHVSLGGNPRFNEHYIDQMLFPE